jgi:poly-gamma-glutamate capsule biosynthesis protein CapA/YwtB (metallophosphatase superfamily)
MRSLLRRLDRFWFAEAPAARLAMLRILSGTYAAWLLWFRYDDILESTRLPASQFQPVGVATFLSTPLPPHVVHALLMLAIIGCVPFVLGLAYRLTGPLFAGLLLTVLTYYASWGSVNHPDALLTAHIFVLGLTRAADAVSLDALIRAWRHGLSQGPRSAYPDPSGAWQYGFAVKLVCAVTATSYLLAGIAKVAGPYGWDWGTGEVLLRQVAWDGLRKELLGQPPPAYAAYLYEHIWLFTLLAVGSVVMELGAPLALLHPRVGYVWALAAIPMHWGIYFVMGISFKYYLWGVAYASFFPLERVPIFFRRSIGAALARIGAGIAVARFPRPARPVDVSVMAVIFGGAMFAAGMLAARALPGGPASVSAIATPPSRQSTVASPRQTPTQAPRPDRTPTAAAIAETDACPAPCELFQVVWVGDILLGDISQRRLDRYGYAWPFEYVRPLLKADFVVGNHEAPITERGEKYFPEANWDYNARPEAADALAEVGFKAIGLSNNHVFDRGPDGLADTLRHLREAGIRPFGAGLDGGEAATPLLISTPHGAIGVLAFGEAWQHGAVAGPDQPGTVTFSDERIAGGAQAARAAGARWVVGYVHWGVNYELVARPRQRRLAATFARAGYSLVVGHHPHVLQGVDIVEGMPVVYSMGNFAFGTGGRFTPQAPGYGLVVRSSFGPRGLHGIELSCILTDNDVVRFQPRPCDQEQARAVVRSLGPGVAWQNGTGLVKLGTQLVGHESRD